MEQIFEINGNDMDIVEQCGLIILGNSGVGKSFLANTLIGREVFAHKFSSRSVTHITESEEIELNGLPLTVFNIPGLIEAQQERIELNKKEIDKAFSLRPNSIVMFVFGQTGGRICEEDIVAFNAINAAYPFQQESLVLVVNGLPKNRPNNYEGSTLVFLQKLLKNIHLNNKNICFLDHIDGDNLDERQYLKEKLLQIIVECNPSEHKKKQEIETLIDKLNQNAQQVKQLQDQIVAETDKYRREIEENQRIFDQTMTSHRTEIESLERAIKHQDELYAIQQQRYEEENRIYQKQLNDLRQQIEEAERQREKLRKEQEAHGQQLQALEAEKQRLHAEVQRLASQPPPPPPPPRSRKKKHWWQKLW